MSDIRHRRSLETSGTFLKARRRDGRSRRGQCAAGVVLARRRKPCVEKPWQESDRDRHRRHGPAIVRQHDASKGCCRTWPRSAAPAASAAWAPAFRRKVPSPGPISSTERDPARTASSTSSIGIRTTNVRRSTRPPKRCRAKAVGKSATIGCSSTSGRSITQPPKTVLRRQGVPFWDYLDAAGIPSTFYDLPSNYPPSPSQYGHHRCICGMGTPDMLGTYGTYQYFSEDAPAESAGRRRRQTIRGWCSMAIRPRSLWSDRKTSFLEVASARRRSTFQCHRDTRFQRRHDRSPGPKDPAQAGAMESLDPTGLCPVLARSAADQARERHLPFLLQEVSPNFRLYVTPINVDPVEARRAAFRAVRLRPGCFGTIGTVLHNGIPGRSQSSHQRCICRRRVPAAGTMVLEERLALFEYAVENYDDGLLFFYFSSSDLQSHMFWWNSDEPHPTRSESESSEILRAHQESLSANWIRSSATSTIGMATVPRSS